MRESKISGNCIQQYNLSVHLTNVWLPNKKSSHSDALKGYEMLCINNNNGIKHKNPFNICCMCAIIIKKSILKRNEMIFNIALGLVCHIFVCLP